MLNQIISGVAEMYNVVTGTNLLLWLIVYPFALGTLIVVLLRLGISKLNEIEFSGNILNKLLGIILIILIYFVSLFLISVVYTLLY